MDFTLSKGISNLERLPRILIFLRRLDFAHSGYGLNNCYKISQKIILLRMINILKGFKKIKKSGKYI